MNLEEYFFSKEKSAIIDDNHKIEFKNMAFISLKIAMKSYFSTYSSISFEHEEVALEDNKEYYEKFISAIVYFHHFFELIIKDILEKEHILLLIKISSKPVIIHKILMGEKIDEGELASINSIEFSEALNTLYKLLENERINNEKYNFFKNKDVKKVLNLLNLFRNRIMHRGKFYLKYEALDEFICKYILGLVKNICSLDDYIRFKSEWIFNEKNALNIDILEELKNEFDEKIVNYSKVNLLKEMGRASYSYSINEEKAELLTKVETRFTVIDDSLKCPVCGYKTLINYQDVETSVDELGDEESGNLMLIEIPYIIVPYAKCACCGFMIEESIGNPSEYGYDFTEFWDKGITFSN